MKQLALIYCLFSLKVVAQFPPVQTIITPMESQKAIVMQRVGITDITIEYSRPAVKGREIWGKVVPFDDGKPFPWRAGANENTTISFGDTLIIDGNKVAPGKYGFFIIPAKEECTIIFSKNNNSWGSFYYRQSEDAVRTQVKPVAGAMKEFLQYEFDEITDSSVVIILAWEKLRIPLKIEVDTKQNMVNYMRAGMRTPLGFGSWLGPYSAAQYCNAHNINIKEAISWCNRSILAEENYFNLNLKSELLRKLGRTPAADSAWDRALFVGSFTELTRAIRGFSFDKNYQKIKEVAKVLEKKFADDWNTYLYLGNAYKRMDDKDTAKKYFNMGLKIAADEASKKRFEDALKELKN